MATVYKALKVSAVKGIMLQLELKLDFCLAYGLPRQKYVKTQGLVKASVCLMHKTEISLRNDQSAVFMLTHESS